MCHYTKTISYGCFNLCKIIFSLKLNIMYYVLQIDFCNFNVISLCFKNKIIKYVIKIKEQHNAKNVLN